MPLIKDGKLVTDGFAAVADDAPLPEGAVAVSLSRFVKDREALLARNTPVAVRLRADESPEKLGADVQRLAAVLLEFPKFRDGRAFSWARQLRTRFQFGGEIRAVGDFLYDQIAYMHRVGFNAFEVSEGFSEQDYVRALGEMTNVYQPSTDAKKTIRELRAH